MGLNIKDPCVYHTAIQMGKTNDMKKTVQFIPNDIYWKQKNQQNVGNMWAYIANKLRTRLANQTTEFHLFLYAKPTLFTSVLNHKLTARVQF